MFAERRPPRARGAEVLVRSLLTRQRGRLLRQAYVNAPGHCNFTAGEELAGINIVVDRVRTGIWPNTSASALDSAATRLNAGDAPAFVSYEPSTYLRPFQSPLLRFLPH